MGESAGCAEGHSLGYGAWFEAKMQSDVVCTTNEDIFCNLI